MVVPDWIWFTFIFAFGCCIGSFLNVVIYRLPRDKSIVTPPSACPGCGRNIRFYDNIPLISWILLGRKCRFCKSPISPRYFIIELVTGLTFLGLFIIYFCSDIRVSVPPFLQGGWLIYLLHIIMLAALISSSAIDLELWIIPLSICWLVTIIGLIGSTAGAYFIDFNVIRDNWLLPNASANTGALALGATAGLVVSLILLLTGLIKRSYESEETEKDVDVSEKIGETKKDTPEKPDFSDEGNFNHRFEALREIIFLLPIIILSLVALWFCNNIEPVRMWWLDFSQRPVIAGLLGSIWGYFVGCGIVWGVRIFGTLAFGKEAMG